MLSKIYGGFVSARGSAEALRRLCGGSAEALRRFCGGSAEALRRLCGGSAKALRRLCGCFVSDAECLFRDALPLDDRPGKLFTRYILLTNKVDLLLNANADCELATKESG